MDVRHQVFVSSTYVDLVEERREVIQALLELECIPAGMEMFPAANEEQWELIKSVIDQSDYYVVIVGGRYGSVTAEGISYTEKEYDYAVERGIPIAGFVHADPGQIPANKSDLDLEAVRRLDAFRAKVRSKVIKTFTDPSSLGGVVSRSLVVLMRAHSRPGWVRGENALTDATRAEIAEMKLRLAESERGAQVTLTDDSLMRGADTFSFRCAISHVYYDGDPAYVTLTETWDDIFGVLGPQLFSPTRSGALRRRLLHWAIARADDSVTEHMSDETHVEIVVDDWDSIIIQLRALGLIEMSPDQSPSGDGVSWQLTAAGDRKLVDLRALRRSATDDLF